MFHKYQDRLLGLIYGFIMLNLSILVYVQLQKYSFKLLYLVIMFLLSFVAFYLPTLFKNHFNRKFFWIGVTLSVFGSWISADFYRYKLHPERYKKLVPKAVSVNPDNKLLTKDSVFSFMNYKIQEKFRGIDTFVVHNEKVEYRVFPLVGLDWGRTDSVQYWACYKMPKMLFGKTEKDFHEQIISHHTYGFEIKTEVDKRKFSDAVHKSIYANNLNLADDYKLVEMIDLEAESNFWHYRVMYTVAIVNIVWFCLAFLGYTKQED